MKYLFSFLILACACAASTGTRIAVMGKGGAVGVPSSPSAVSVISGNLTSFAGSTNNLFSFSADCTGANFAYVFLAALDFANLPTVTSITLNGVPMTAGPTINNSGVTKTAGYYLVSPPSGSQTIQVTFANNVDSCDMHFIPMSGVGVGSPVNTGASAKDETGSSSTATVNAASAVGELVLAFVFPNAASVTPGGGQTILLTSGSLQSTSKAGGAGTVTSSWTLDVAGVWDVVSQSIKP